MIAEQHMACFLFQNGESEEEEVIRRGKSGTFSLRPLSFLLHTARVNVSQNTHRLHNLIRNIASVECSARSVIGDVL